MPRGGDVCDVAPIERASVRALRVSQPARRVVRERLRQRTLMATSRLSVVSSARYTSPMPPAPSVATILYGPRRVPMLMSSGVEYTA